MVAEKSYFSSNAKHNFDIHWSVWMNIEKFNARNWPKLAKVSLSTEIPEY